MIYHYTKALHLLSIIAHGLQPSTELLAEGEKPVLWFSTNHEWEKTVFPIDAPSLSEAHQKMRSDGGLARIGCDDSVAPHRWKEIRDIASIPARLASGLYRSAIQVGSRPGEWRATLDSVPPEDFRVVEFYDGKAWIADAGAATLRAA